MVPGQRYGREKGETVNALERSNGRSRFALIDFVARKPRFFETKNRLALTYPNVISGNQLGPICRPGLQN